MVRSTGVHRGAVTLLLVSGTVSSIFGKSIYLLKAPGRDGKDKYFSKPLAATLFMFLGMMLCLPATTVAKGIRRAVRYYRHDGHANEPNEGEEAAIQEPLLRATESHWSMASLVDYTASWWRQYDAVLLPTVFDLAATLLMSVGLLFTTASVYQMVRGSEIIFTAILSMVFLRRRLNKLNVWGLALCLLGILIVAASSVLDSHSGSKACHNNLSLDYSSSGPTAAQTLIGMALIVVAELVQASQIVVEEWLMSTAPTKIPPIELVGYEGLFGTLLLTGILLPLAQISRLGPEGSGLREDSIETLGMLCQSHQLAGIAVAYIVLMGGYNVAGMMVTDGMGALSRTVAETMRTMMVWGLDLYLYYNARSQTARVGEPWSKHSWLQAVGFGVLVAGTALYGAGEEMHATKVRQVLERKARERWAMVRASMAHLAAMGREEVPEVEARCPFRPARIAGPARIRVALCMLQARARRRAAERECGCEEGAAAETTAAAEEEGP